MRPIVVGIAAALSIGAATLLAIAPAQAINGPKLQFQPSPSPAFGTVAVGTSTSLTFTLENKGSSSTSAIKVTLTSDTGFTIAPGDDKCSGLALSTKKTCTVRVTYSPAVAGAANTATLTARSAKPNAASVTLNLTGSSSVDVTGQCWTGFFDSRTEEDLLFVGPINTLDNADFYPSTDGTCTGETQYSLTLVQADTSQDASAICETLIAGPYDRMDALSIVEGGYAAAPADFWFCSPYIT
jgi:hypothetical protein